MDTNRTVHALSRITDDGLFERLAMAILREADPKYAALIHTGVNAGGKTIKAPVDGISYFPGADPPHLVAVHHTTCLRKDLEKKWLHDPSTVKRRGTLKYVDQPGDVPKTVAIVRKERQATADLLATLVLTTNEEPPEHLVRAARTAGAKDCVEIDIWSRSRLGHFLDNNPAGQWIRRAYLGIDQELLSPELLSELSRISINRYAPSDDPESAWVDRELDITLKTTALQDVTFLVAGSGEGKSVAAYRWLKAHVDRGGWGVVVPHAFIESAYSLERIIEAVLRDLHPTLIFEGSGRLNQILSSDRPLHLIVEDINRASNPQSLVERICNWAMEPSKDKIRLGSAWRLVCPVWPSIVAASAEQLRSRIDRLSLYGGSFTPQEAHDAVVRRARLSGRNISSLEANSIAAALGNDPLLIALNGSNEDSSPEQVIESYIQRSVARTASRRGQQPSPEYRSALRSLALAMLVHRNLDPTWTDITSWHTSADNTRALLGELLHTGEVVRFLDSAEGERIKFRHDRVREQLMVDAAIEAVRSDSLPEDIVADPFFAEVLAGVASTPSTATSFVHRLKDLNPLSLFFALRRFQEPRGPLDSAVLTAIDEWLANPATHSSAKTHLRWNALLALADTDSSYVIQLVYRFRRSWYSHEMARLRNGDVWGGVELCARLEPGVGAPWRDAQIAHAKLHHGSALIAAVNDLLARDDLNEESRVGALRFAGHLADPALEDGIEASWKADDARDQRVDEYLWAAAECVADNPARLLGPICDLWSALDNSPKGSHTLSPRMAVPEQWLRWAFDKWPPAKALPYFVSRAHEEELRWPITYLLENVDHPTAVLFEVDQISSLAKRAEETKGFSVFVSSATNRWDTEFRGRRMSDAARSALVAVWQDTTADRQHRTQAFRLWAVAHDQSDLDLLRALATDPELADRALHYRLMLRDFEAVPLLLAKLERDNADHWWRSAHRVWTADIASAFDRTLTKRGEGIGKGSADFYRYASELIMRMATDAGEALLINHWANLRRSPYFVQAALYLATPRLRDLVEVAVGECPTPAELFEHIDMHFGVRVHGHPGVTRQEQIGALEPYFEYIGEHAIFSFWNACNEMGWFSLRRQLLDTRLTSNLRPPYLDRQETYADLDKMIQENRTHWIDYWVDRFLETGASWDEIWTILTTWFDERRSVKALELLCDAVMHSGRRVDLAPLRYDPPSPKTESLIEDATFAVRRRRLR